ncbi:hypothetical protein AND_008457 [Anopheles darlingi]|uniref:Uncharacterized protein n=1 Tax=Anopheles darlingi TaxID=43151 RepID=W5J970_ANODA|nr:hypothetical protein AND_008457 [Anopheles darlingi]
MTKPFPPILNMTNNDPNAETDSIVSQSITIDNVKLHQTPATDLQAKSITKKPTIVEVLQQEVCAANTTNIQATDCSPILPREVTQERASEDVSISIDLPKTTPTGGTGNENESLKNPNETVLSFSQGDYNGDEILASTIQTSNKEDTPKVDAIENNTVTGSLADAIMDSKSAETPIESGTEKNHALEAKPNDTNATTVVVEAAADQTISSDQQKDSTQGFTEPETAVAGSQHSAKLQLPFEEPTCNFTEWNDGISSSSKYLTKPVNPRIRALIKEAVVFKKALNNLKLASKLTEPIDLTEALVTQRRLPSKHATCSAVQNYPSTTPVTQKNALDGTVNKTTNNQLVPSSNSHQGPGAASNVTRQYNTSKTSSSNFGTEFLKITSTCTISTSSINRTPASGADCVLSLQQIRGQSSTAVNGTINELSRSEPRASASLSIMARSEPNYAVYTPWRSYFKDSNDENESVELNKSPTKRVTPVEEQPVTTLNAPNPTTNDQSSPTYSVPNAATTNTRHSVDFSLKQDQLDECSASSSTNRDQQRLSLAASSSTKEVAATCTGTGELADSPKQPTTADAPTINSKRRMSVDCLPEDKRHRAELSTDASRSACLSKEFFSSIALPIVSALDFIQPKPRCTGTGAKTVPSTPKSKAPAPPQTPPTPMVVLHSPAKSSRTPLKCPPMMESEFDANSSVQNIMDSLLKTPIKTEINDELEHDGNVSGINESMFSNVSAISHDVLNKSYFSTENPLSAVKSEPEEEKTPVKQTCELATVDLVSPWHTAISSTPVTATKSIPRIESADTRNVSVAPTDISSSNIFLCNSDQISPNNSTIGVFVDEEIVPRETTQNITNVSSECTKIIQEAHQKSRSAKKKKKKEKNPLTDGNRRRAKKKQQRSVDTSSTSSKPTSTSTCTFVPLPSTNEPREQLVPQPAQRDCATISPVPNKTVTTANDITPAAITPHTIKATREHQSTEVVNYETDVATVAQKPTDCKNLTTESVNTVKSAPSVGANMSAPAVGPTMVAATTTSGTTDKENVPWVKKESILRTPGQYVTPDGPVNFVREMRVVKESPNYMRVYITRKKV